MQNQERVKNGSKGRKNCIKGRVRKEKKEEGRSKSGREAKKMKT